MLLQKSHAPKLTTADRHQLAEMERVLNSKSLRDKVMKELCQRLHFENEYGDCIQYGLAMREWKDKYGQNPTSPEAKKEEPLYRFTGAPPPAGYERPLSHASIEDVL